jgi:tetratricopeptide (TPR) repeat protein
MRVVPRLPMVIGDIVAAPEAAFVSVVWQQTLVIAAVMLPMTTAVGTTLPLCVQLCAREPARVAGDVGRLYGINAVAAVAGAGIAGFWLVPVWGLELTLRMAISATVAAALAIALLTRPGASRATAAIVLVSGLLAVTWVVSRWDPALVSSGAYKYAAFIPREHRDVILRAGTLLSYEEGASATVSVRRVTGTTSLAIDGKVDATNAGDMLTQQLLAHLPLLMHRQAKSVGVIGLGSGVTVGSALTHPVDRVDVIEISPEVVRASAFFARENRGALGDARTRLLVADGRTHLRLSRQRYDVLISEPSNPWMAGIAALFTREFFVMAQQRLAPGGVFCQWAHTYDISDADLRSIVATFVGVFPEALLVLVGDGDVLLLGFDQPPERRFDQLRQGWPPPVAEDLARVGVTTADVLLGLIVAGGPVLAQYGAGAAMQTDDRLALEFSAPRGIYGRLRIDHARTLRALGEQNRPVELGLQEALARGRVLMGAEAYDAAFDAFARALEVEAGDAAAPQSLVAAAGPAGRLADAETLLSRLHATHPEHPAVAVALSKLHGARGDFRSASAMLRAWARGAAPLPVLDQLAAIAADANDEAGLALQVGRLVDAFPESDAAFYFSATLAAMRRQPELALRFLAASRARQPTSRVLNLHASIAEALGRLDEARAALLESLQLQPRDLAVYEALGHLEMRALNAGAARDAYAEGLTLDPLSPTARAGLTAALKALRR